MEKTSAGPQIMPRLQYSSKETLDSYIKQHPKRYVCKRNKCMHSDGSETAWPFCKGRQKATFLLFHAKESSVTVRG